MGGTIFIGGFCIAVASNQKGRDVVTQASQITFLKSAKGKASDGSGTAGERWEANLFL